MDLTPAANQAARGERLESWKEIAAYLKRDIRTVQRWEKQEALPVYRHVHDERGTAYAYAGEIDEWLRQRSRREVDATAGNVTCPELVAESTRALARSPSRTTVLIAFSIVLASIIGIWALSRPRPDRTPLSSLSLVFAPSERFHDWGPDTALSPDGSTLVYASTLGQLHIRRIEQFTARVVPDTSGSWGPFFSPDGRWIGFNRQGQLMKVSVDGGTPMPLGATTPFIGGADWGVDDRIVYGAITPRGTHGLYQVAASGGSPQLITALAEGNADNAYFLTPQWLPNGKVILCTLARTVTSGSRFQVIAVSPSTGEHHVLVDDARHAMYIGDGVLVFWQNAALFATRFDADRVQVIGSPVPAWDDVWERLRIRSWTSAAGTLVYWPAARVSHRLVWVDRSGKQEPLPLPPAMYHAPRVSPDGRSIAYAIGDDLNSDVWKYDLATGATVRLTSGGRSAVPLWTPDGQRLIVSWLRASGGRDLAELHLRGTSEPGPIALPASFLPGASKLPVGWADAGRTLLLRVSNQQTMWAVTLDGTRQPRPVTPSARYADISDDGRWVAYSTLESIKDPSQVYVAPYPYGRPEWKVSTAGGVLPVWAKNGQELFYRSGDRIMGVPVTLGETFSSGTPQPLFEAPFYEGDPGSPNYDVAPDGQRFVMVFPSDTGGPARLHVVQGWKAEILRRLRDAH
jgi:Tol biopolymer transport system component